MAMTYEGYPTCGCVKIVTVGFPPFWIHKDTDIWVSENLLQITKKELLVRRNMYTYIHYKALQNYH